MFALLAAVLRPFQLTHSRGVRRVVAPTNVNGFNFNSRTHVECDICQLDDEGEVDNFNSRTHVECDLNQNPEKQTRSISTHALTWSATTVRQTADLQC